MDIFGAVMDTLAFIVFAVTVRAVCIVPGGARYSAPGILLASGFALAAALAWYPNDGER